MMKNIPAHKKRSFRKMTAIVMMAVYLLIVLSPLAPCAMYSKTVAHAVTGECSGDCTICGCSVESRANQSCCCAKKKQQGKLSAGLPKPATVKRSCCAESKPVAPIKDCCAKSGQHPHDENAQKLNQKLQPSKSETVYKCGCPCGKGKTFALAAGSSESMPYFYADRLVPSQAHSLDFPFTHRMTSRHSEPPDPPPKLTAAA